MATRHRSLFTTAVLAAAIAVGVPMAASANADTSPTPSTSVAAGADHPPHPPPRSRPWRCPPPPRRLPLPRLMPARSPGPARPASSARRTGSAVASSPSPSPRSATGTSGARSAPAGSTAPGLAKYVYAHAAHKSLPHYSRAQFQKLRHVSKGARKPGDLVFFLRGGMEHVGIYIGGGRMVNAQSPRSGVRVAALSAGWVSPHYSGAGSLF